MADIHDINEKLKEEEKLILEELDNTCPGSATREDLLKELERLSEIRRKNEESIVRRGSDILRSQNDSERNSVEVKKAKYDLIAKLVATGSTVLLGIIVLSFEEKGVIRSKIFGWIKPRT